MMRTTPEATVAELQRRFPNGFAVGPGTPKEPGCLSRIVLATSRLRMVVAQYPIPEGNMGYMVVDMEDGETKESE